MPALTPSFVFDFETRLRKIELFEYAALAASENMWWQKITKTLTSGARREIMSWILNTAQIQSQGKLGGNIAFEDMVMLETEFEPEFAGKGIKLRRAQFEDLDGNGVQLGTEWVRQISAQGAYWPQKLITALLKNGQTQQCYDGKNFFATDHPYNPFNIPAGSFSNLILNVPIDSTVAPDVALANLQKIFGHIGSIKMPNGEDPRMLKPFGIGCSPVLFPRLVQLTNAKFIAQVAGATGAVGGSADIEALIQSLGYGQPINMPEISGWESDTSYFVLARAVAAPTNDLSSGFVYIEREPFGITYYTGRGGGNAYVDAILDRAQELEWHTSGRNIAGYGHPWVIFKCKAGAS